MIQQYISLLTTGIDTVHDMGCLEFLNETEFHVLYVTNKNTLPYLEIARK